MQRLTAADRYEILYDLESGDYGEREVGGVRTKTIRAGDSLEVEAFPIIRIDDGAKREATRRRSSIAQQRLNDENAKKRICRLLEANFTERDIVLHPTFDYGFVDRGFANMDSVRKEWEQLGYPRDMDEAKRVMRNFLARLKRMWVRRGGELTEFKWLYVVESTREPRDGDFNALPARYHYHMVVSGRGVLSIEDVNACWRYGYTKAQALDMRFNGLQGLAKYISKQLHKGRRRWAKSNNLREPDVRVSDRRISRRRAAKIAMDVQANGREILEQLYPEYALEDVRVRFSDFVAGAYIYARMRRRR